MDKGGRGVPRPHTWLTTLITVEAFLHHFYHIVCFHPLTKTMDTAVMPRERVLRSEAPPTCRHNLTFASASSPICHMNFAICCLRSNIAHSISSLNGYLNTLLAAVVDWSAGVLLPLVTAPTTEPR